MCRYVDLLSTWNAKVNLISRRDVENIWFSHILHSLAPWFRHWLPAGRSVLDIGSGGGLPGIPLAILRRDLRLVLLDSIQKKTKALGEICAELNLPNVQVINGRAEDVGTRAEYALRFSAVLARGVAPLTDLIRWSRPFLSARVGDSGGVEHLSGRIGVRVLDAPCLLAWKGGDLRDEITRASNKTQQKIIEVFPLVMEGGQLPGLEKKQLVLVKF
jgi:16S rRNA (guanine(527)-N(7))-methyltransferase RsmG